MEKHMKKVLIALAIAFALTITCKDRDRFAEPNYMLIKWAKSIQALNYRDYSSCEAYPKTEPVFREMYKDYFLTDVMTTAIEDADEKNKRNDQDGNAYLHRSVSFECNVVNRGTKKPYQIMRGDAVFIRFLDGKRAKDGWLISNRTLIRINR
jgi:hypothetical protein